MDKNLLAPRTAPPSREEADRGVPAGLTPPARAPWPRGDAIALLTLLAIILVAVGFRFVYDNWLSQWDIIQGFLPNYGYVGDRLRALQVPAWNPYFSSGTPMAGDSGGGWMYLPVMLAFSLFPVAFAMKMMVLLQALIGGLATYLLGRRLGLVPLAALFAATAIAVGPALYDATGQSTVIGQISTFTPVAVLGAETALHADRWSARLAWCGLTGVALVQLFAAWPQGFVYGVMFVAAWFAYRGVCAPLPNAGSRRVQLGRTLLCGLATAAFAAALSAAALLPRLDFSAESTIPVGDYSHVVGADYVANPSPVIEILSLYLQNSFFWRIIEFNSVVLLLGLLAIFLGSTRYGIPFFVVAAWLSIDLAATESVTRNVFYLLPQFARIHSHRPTATMYMVYLPFAMLAGAGVQLLLDGRRVRGDLLRRLLPLPILLLAIWAVERAGHAVGWLQISLAGVATVLIVAPAIRFRAAWTRAGERLPGLAAAGLLVLTLVYPSGVDFLRTMQNPDNIENNLLSKNPSIDQAIQTILARRDPGTAAALLQDMQATQPPFRYAAYFGTDKLGDPLDPRNVAILAGARSARLGLEQTSGYNPLHLEDYVEYFEAMDGARQNYHWLAVYAAALSGSQLLDMLNVRFVLLPADLPRAPPIAASGVQVYRDDRVVVYENPRAFPRAWLVHDVRPDHDGDGLALLAEGAVDGHAVAFVDGPVPPTTVPRPAQGATGSPADRVVVTGELPESVTIQATAVADGLLVVSEPYEWGWDAYVDGEKVAVLRTDHALQGVPLAAGDHTVVLRYEPRSLAVGLWITGAAVLALAAVWAWALIDRLPGARGVVRRSR
jgi:hypothetical protein